MQLERLHPEIERLQKVHGDPTLSPVYGTGCVKNPKIMLMFMNPTGRNVSTNPAWPGIRASWLGTKNIWHLLHQANLLAKSYLEQTQAQAPEEWTPSFAQEIYQELARNGVFLTNLAKCTQLDARPLKDSVFKDYLHLTQQEILETRPAKIITFGNQVSSILLNKPISVSKYSGTKSEILEIDKEKFNVFPTYYPVGRGRMNMPLAVKRIRAVLY